ncbi:MAG TPA: hypothetical protein VFW07_14105 [Parafilimonas sp.]|nr:hypothetical protein [Parafilimonas sp.]
MDSPLIAIVGDITPGRTLNPKLSDPVKAKRAAEELGAELAKCGAHLLVYGGPFLEADIVRGFVGAKPKDDHSILMWFTKGNEPPPFAEETTNPKLFKKTIERGADWEIAFYRSITRADGIILMGGGNATKISGQIAIGTKMPILALAEFGGGAANVWDTISAGQDLPTREEIDLMSRSWTNDSAAECIKALLNQRGRKKSDEGKPKTLLSILAGFLFLLALSIVPWIWGKNQLSVWFLFIVPLLAGGAGAAIRPIADRQRGVNTAATAILVTIVLGLIAGGIAGVLFVTAQLTASPSLTTENLDQYAQRSIPFALGIGFVAGLTSDAVFGKLLGLDVTRVSGVSSTPERP